MQTKYPKKQKTKVLSNKTTTNTNANDILTDQQYQIDELKTKAIKTDIENSYTESQKEKWNRAYGKALNLEYELDITNRHACNAHTRIDEVELQLATIVTNADTTTVDLSSLTKVVNSNTQTIRNNALEIENLNINVEQNTRNIENLNTQVMDNTARIKTLEENGGAANTDDLENQIIELSAKVETNAQDIKNFGSQIEASNYILTETQNTIDDIKNDLDELQTTTNTNSQDIQTLNLQVETNTQQIAELKQNIGNGSGDNTGETSADITQLTEQVNINKQEIVDLKNQQTSILNQQTINTADIAALLAFKQKIETPDDPYYAPKSFSDYPAGTILQGFAEYGRPYNINDTATLVTPPIKYSALAESTGKLKIKLQFTTNISINCILYAYNNDAQIYEEQIIFDNDSLDYTIEREIAGIALSDANEFYFEVKASNNTTKFVLTYMYSALIAPNAETLDYVSPYNVDCFNGKYYISDCTGETAKIAEIAVEDMHNMSNLNWIDTGKKCFYYKPSFNVTKYDDECILENRIDYYENENGLYIYNTVTGLTANSPYYTNLFWIQQQNILPSYFANYINTNKLYFIFPDTSYNTLYSSAYTTQDYVRCVGTRFNLQDTNIMSYSIRVTVNTTPNGNNYIEYLNNMSKYSNLQITPGINNHMYYESYTDRYNFTINCYTKYFDKIIKNQFQCTEKEGFKLLSTTEIGAYEEYFEGVNNDYFVVKNGKLEYHKKPIKTVEIENETVAA